MAKARRDQPPKPSASNSPLKQLRIVAVKNLHQKSLAQTSTVSLKRKRAREDLHANIHGSTASDGRFNAIGHGPVTDDEEHFLASSDVDEVIVHGLTKAADAHYKDEHMRLKVPRICDIDAETDDSFIIEQWYADPYERLNPGSDMVYDEWRRSNLLSNLVLQGWDVSRARPLSNWLSRCNGKRELYGSKRKKGGINSAGNCKRESKPCKKRDIEMEATMVSKNDDNKDNDGDEVNDPDDSVGDLEVLRVLEGIISDSKSTPSIHAEDEQIMKIKQSIKLFDMVYGPHQPKPSPAFEVSYFPNHITNLPRAVPKSGFRTQHHGPVKTANVQVSRLNLPSTPRYKDDDFIEVPCEDPFAGDIPLDRQYLLSRAELDTYVQQQRLKRDIEDRKHESILSQSDQYTMNQLQAQRGCSHQLNQDISKILHSQFERFNSHPPVQPWRTQLTQGTPSDSMADHTTASKPAESETKSNKKRRRRCKVEASD